MMTASLNEMTSGLMAGRWFHTFSQFLGRARKVHSDPLDEWSEGEIPEMR